MKLQRTRHSMRRRISPQALREMANPPESSHLKTFEDDGLRVQIEKDLISDIQLAGLDPSGVMIGPLIGGRFKPHTDTLINQTGSGTIVQVIYNEEIVGSLYYFPNGWQHGFRFGTSTGMFNLLDVIANKETGYHHKKYNEDDQRQCLI